MVSKDSYCIVYMFSLFAIYYVDNIPTMHSYYFLTRKLSEL